MDGNLTMEEFINKFIEKKEGGGCMEVKLSQEVIQRIDQLAHTVGVTSDKLATILTKQGIVEGYMSIGCLFIAILFACLTYKAFKKSLDEVDPSWVFAIGLCAIITIGFLFASTGIVYLFNPEYFVVTKLLTVIK